MKNLRLALTKGRLEKNTVELLKNRGFDVSFLEDKGRRLILPVPGSAMEVVLAKSADVITYVERGVCDLGVVGKDTIMENGRRLYEVMDLGFGRCRFCLISNQSDFYRGFNKKVIATKYPKVAKEFFDKKGMDIEIIKIEGSVELAPLLGLSDAIVDIVETGTTIRENGLHIIEDIADISARLIVNVASMKLKKTEIEAFMEKIR